MKTTISKSFLLMLLVLLSIESLAHQTENIKVKQLKNKINIIYDLTHERIGQVFNVKAYYSTDGGTTFQGPLDSLKGDYGKGVKGGKDKVISWDVLAERPGLKGNNIVFKVVAKPIGIDYPKDQTGDFSFQLKRCTKNDNHLELALSITNHGKEKDLRIPNRLARLYNYDNERLEAYKSIHGNVSGDARFSQPQVTLKKGQTINSKFSFRIRGQSISRVKLFQLGFDILKITHGIDVNPTKIEFRDFPVFQKDEKVIAEAVSKSKSFDIGKKTTRPDDTEAPKIIVQSPNLKRDQPPLISNEKVQIRGKVTDESGIFELRVNNEPTDINENGHFQAMVSLEEGFNEIILHATDIMENSIEEKYDILHLPPDEKTKEKLRKIAEKEAEETKAIRSGNYHALIIGENEYEDPLITDLDNPIEDSKELYNIIKENYAFKDEHITFLKNPTRSEIMVELDNLNDKLTEKDNLLVFYAGHGYWDSEDEIGYWLPSDADSENTANWFRNSTLREYIHSLDTKHTIVIADACFSGSIFKTRKAFANAPQGIKEIYKLPSRKAMTSGNLKEVPDESVFMKYLVKRLTNNQKKYMTAEELFNSLKVAVMNNSPNEPQYGEIKNAGDEGGDFIFVKQSSSN
jgi:hypothetical protein